MKTHVEFRSDKFPAYENEDDMVNPGMYGKRLAQFIANGLRGVGFETGEPFAEDWGWIVEIHNEGFALWIGCGNYPHEETVEPRRHRNGFLCFIETEEPEIDAIETDEKVEALQKAMDQILSEEAGIREKRWSTYEEFNPS